MIPNYYLKSILKSVLFILFYLLHFVICDQMQTRTLYGRNITIKEAPFIAGILVARTDICTGSLISDNIVLTSINCLKSMNTLKDVKVYLGTEEIDEYNTNYQTISAVYTNPKGRATNDAINLALIKLSKHIEMNETINTVRVEQKPWPSGLEQYSRLCFAMGFGKHNKTGKMGRLHGSQVATEFGPKACGCASLGRRQKMKIICMNNLGNDRFCYGDTGGPLICDDALVGVAHTVIKCENSTKNIKECGLNSTVDTYIYLYNHLKWLSFIMKSKVVTRTAIGELNDKVADTEDIPYVIAHSGGHCFKFGFTELHLVFINIIYLIYIC